MYLQFGFVQAIFVMVLLNYIYNVYNIFLLNISSIYIEMKTDVCYDKMNIWTINEQ